LVVERQREFPHHRVHQPRLRRTRQDLGLLHRVVDNLGHKTLVRVTGHGLDELETREIEHGPRRKARRVGDQLGQMAFQPARMAHDPENQVLAPRPLRARKLASKRVEQGVDPLAPFQPARHQLRRHRPGPKTGNVGFFAHTHVVSRLGLTALVIVRSTLPFRPLLTQP